MIIKKTRCADLEVVAEHSFTEPKLVRKEKRLNALNQFQAYIS